MTPGKANLILSMLARHGWLRREAKGVYCPVEPEEVVRKVAIMNEVRKNLGEIPQRGYAGVLARFMELAVERYGERLMSAVVFGSVARGDATPTSDIDLLLVIERLPESLGTRYAEAAGLKREFYGSPEYVENLLRGLSSPVSLVLLTPDEAKGFHSVYLDMTLHRRVLYDGDGFMMEVLSRLSERLEGLLSERLTVEGKPVWVVKPGLRRGEVVSLE